ncbi:protein phosphatase 2C domain-containing protein [Nitrospirillum amazonense]|uniref:Protein phosphatase 2C-like protein n=1 Tax=Nitrospirillum amazonense TaxID=28077 RepID=A0A560JDD1_9PROT|nr:protein phosphatase 2C domain-containing protein [Nitrospirillum amazonense]MDG3438997.1 protein phosphatase 2C domain-containing protein [Nitrospirillum amazonense]TWB69201.1 protein phosphatase 2C-like protein [Nitrospirillum amazonense]
MFQVRALISDAGSTSANEDVAGHCGGWAWVIDGATGVSGATIEGLSDAAWFARQVDGALRRRIPDGDGLPTDTVLRQVVEDCAQGYAQATARTPRARHERPSAAFALLRRLGERLEMTTLGDCQIIHRDAGGQARLFGTSAIPVFEERTLAAARLALAEAPDLSPTGLWERVVGQLRTNRQFMNVDGGYWVLSTDTAALAHVDRATIPVGNGPVALASDGFLRLIDMFGQATAEDFLGWDDQAKADAALRDLRRIEAMDDPHHGHLRLKRADDASFILVHPE